MLSLLILMPSLYSHCNLLVSSHFKTDLITVPRAAKKYLVVGSLDYSCICMYTYVEKCMSTRARSIGGLLAHINLSSKSR